MRTTPAPGVEVESGSVVRFVEFTGLVPDTPAEVPEDHPESVRVPDVVGLTYSEAARALEIGLAPVVDVDELPPLSPEASMRGVDAYVVAAQDREPGSELPYLTVNPSASSVVLTLSLKP